MSTESKQPDSPQFPTVGAIYAARAASAESREPWLHPICQSLPTERKGPFTRLADGSLLTVDRHGLTISRSAGRAWAETIPAAHGQDPAEPASCAVLEPQPRTLVMAFLDRTAEHTRFSWNSETGEPASDCRCELHAIRSLDGGHNWRDRQCLLDGYNANFFGFIRTTRGRLVLVAEHLVTNPGRWVVCSFASDDHGKTWQRSNLIDLGGHGHHDGATEPTVVELGDGRLLMLIRTNLGRFWQAVSADDGRYWRTIQPSAIDASSSPGQLLRLTSGRLVLAWNRRDPEDWTWPLSKPDTQHSEVPASWHREELSIAISEDDARTWSRPLVITRIRGGQVSYPHLLEPNPGVLWLIPGFASRKWFNEDPVPVAMRIDEAHLLREITG